MDGHRAGLDYIKRITNDIAENVFTPAGPRNLTRVSALLAILSDDADHYGEMVEYLRMNGIVPPGTVNQMHRTAQAPPQK